MTARQMGLSKRRCPQADGLSCVMKAAASLQKLYLLTLCITCNLLLLTCDMHSEQAQNDQAACALAATLLSKLQSADQGADQSSTSVCGLLEYLGDALGTAGSLFSNRHMFVTHCLQRTDAMLQIPSSSIGKRSIASRHGPDTQQP